jgi:tetrapyrrole methylase family protein/MazG family protein
MTTPATARSARVTVVGLGPGGPGLVTAETMAAIGRIPQRFVRTTDHPTADLVPDATAFDDVYERADTFEAVYSEIADTLALAAGESGEVLYAVPGSPLVLERTVQLLRARDDITVDVLSAISFLDVAWARLGIDPVEDGVRLVDGHEFATAAAGERGPLLVAHTHANWVLSEIKLAADGATGDEAVVILQRLGTPDEKVVRTTWNDVDRAVDADHLTSLFVPELSAPVGGHYVRFHQLTRTLREQCPWDIEQTHESLVPHLLEETYEVVDAVQALNPDDAATDEHLIEELGDLLYQIEFHAVIAEQQGRFTITDVVEGIHDKLVRRHPHVFGAVDVDGVDEVLSNWDEIKRIEKGRTSVFEGVPRSLPSLAYAHKVGHKASKVGFDWPDVSGAFAKIHEETAELETAMVATETHHARDELGDLLFAIVNVARHLDIDPELALRAATDKFRTRFEGVERRASELGIEFRNADLATLDALWDEVKADET